ncbi:MAG: LemA family protein [Candidatus Aminicenantes bacterium]|nr:LemA family protein [Candidatus Aminicenantes bacterium]
MKKVLIVLGVSLGVLLVLFLIIGMSLTGSYNRLVTLNEGVESAWAQVETVLQRRYDLIPNLVNTVKGFAAQEREVFTEVTRLRSQWGAARTTADKAQVAGRMEGALSRLLLVAERYPDLKSNQNFLALQDELTGTENRIAVERRRYNQTVQNYNTTVRRFPINLVAGFFGFERSTAYFEASEGAETAPTVEF